MLVCWTGSLVVEGEVTEGKVDGIFVNSVWIWCVVGIVADSPLAAVIP